MLLSRRIHSYIQFHDGSILNEHKVNQQYNDIYIGVNASHNVYHIQTFIFHCVVRKET